LRALRGPQNPRSALKGDSSSVADLATWRESRGKSPAIAEGFRGAFSPGVLFDN
jgi:hypothetical protein